MARSRRFRRPTWAAPKGVVLRAIICGWLVTSGCGTTPTDVRDAPSLSQAGASERVDTLAPVYGAQDPDRIPNRYIVRFKPTVSSSRALSESIIAARGGRVYQVLEGLKGFWGELPPTALEELRRNPQVAYIEADIAYRTASASDTIQSGAPGPLDRIDQRTLPLNGQYLYSANGQGVRIWIVDGGVDRNEPELACRIDESLGLTFNSQDPYSTANCFNHGTWMAIAAAGSVSGIAKQATIHSARVNSDCVTGISSGAASSAIEWIADNSPRPAIINYSASKNCVFPLWCPNTVDDAARYAWSKGVTVVVSAGDDNNDTCNYAPARVAELITVGASDPNNDVRHGYSNWGSCLDLFAPVIGGAGSSTAAAMVTGVATLELQLRPTASPNHVKATVLNKATLGVLLAIGPFSPNRLLYSRQPTLTAVIEGPSFVGANVQCTWYGAHTGGQPPYSVEWRRDGVLVGTGLSYSAFPVGPTDFDLSFQVTDGVGRIASALKQIVIDPESIQFVCT